MEEKNDNFSFEYQQVCRAKDFFEELAGWEKLALKKKPSLLSLFTFFLNKTYSDLFKFIEKIVGIPIYAPVGDSPLSKISPRVKRIAANLVEKKIIKKIMKLPQLYPDEPRIIQYQTEMPSTLPDISSYSDGRGTSIKSGWGTDFEEERAFMKGIGEGLERFCLCVYREKNLLLSSFDKISKNALDPLSFSGISPSQRKSVKELKIDEKSIFRWVKGFSLFDRKKVLIPAQLVYIGYKYHSGEPMIQEQLSTGAAAAPSFDEALYEGICEAVERDAFMITYFNKLSPPLIELESIEDQSFQRLLKMFKRYNLDLYMIDMTTDIKMPSVMAIVIDRTGVGPVVHVGNKTNLNMKKAILGAAFEVLQGRIGFRRFLPFSKELEEKIAIVKKNPSQIRTFADRFLFWQDLEMLEKLDFLFRGEKKKIGEDELNFYQHLSGKEKLKISLKLLRKRGIDIYGVDITFPPIKEEGIYVAKVVSPQLQPLYLNERIRHVWGERMFNVPVELGYRDKPLTESELNPLPHPFL